MYIYEGSVFCNCQRFISKLRQFILGHAVENHGSNIYEHIKDISCNHCLNSGTWRSLERNRFLNKGKPLVLRVRDELYALRQTSTDFTPVFN